MRNPKTILALVVITGSLLVSGSTVASAAFEITGFSGLLADQEGATFSQAAGHPSNQTTSFEYPAIGPQDPDGQVKDIDVDLPAGFLGQPSGPSRPVHRGRAPRPSESLSRRLPGRHGSGSAVRHPFRRTRLEPLQHGSTCRIARRVCLHPARWKRGRQSRPPPSLRR